MSRKDVTLTPAQEKLLRAVKKAPGEHVRSIVLKGLCDWPRGGISRSMAVLVDSDLVRRGLGALISGYHITPAGEAYLAERDAKIAELLKGTT